MESQPAPFDMKAWWERCQAEGKSAVEAAREFGVDIEQLHYLRSRTPSERLSYLESMLEFVVEGRAAIERQKIGRHGGQPTTISGVDASVSEQPD